MSNISKIPFETCFRKHDAIMLLVEGETGQLIDANDAALRFYGYTIEQIESMKLGDISALSPEELDIAIQLSLQEKKNCFIVPHRLANGEMRTVEVHNTSIAIENRKCLFSIIHDITDHKLAEKTLLESEERYRILFEQSGDSIALVEPTSLRILEANKNTTVLLGYSHEELCSMRVTDLDIVATPEEAFDHSSQIVKTGKETFETKKKCKDGTILDIEVTVKPISIQGKTLIQALWRDITESKKTEAALRESESRYRAVVEDQTEVICRFRKDGTVIFANDVFCRFFGKSLGELIGAKWQPVAVTDDVPQIEEKLRSISPSNPVVVIENRIYDGSGRVRWMQFVNRGFFDPQGGLIEIQAVGRDITERKRVEEALRYESEMRQTILDNIPVMVTFFDREGRRQFINRCWQSTIGWSLEEILQHKDIFAELFPDPENKKNALDCFKRVGGLKSWTDFKSQKRDGSVLDTSWINVPLSDGSIIGIGIDITDRKLMEERLRQMQKMDAIGQLAGGVAHDFNNQLAVIMGYAEFIAQRCQPGEIRTFTEKILRAVRHSADLAGKLLAFARKGQHFSVLVDMHKIIVETAQVLSDTIDKRIRIQQILKARSALIQGDPSQLQNALLNLGLNARDAMDEGGTLTFETETVELDARSLSRHPLQDLAPGEYLLVKIIDTGRGMSEVVKQHLFEPFFTTKGLGKGTGMGLASAHGAIHIHKGAIHAVSEEGQGTTFEICLPLMKQGRLAVPAAEGEARKAIANLRILVVEDVQVVQELFRQQLESAGHHVVAAANGAEAVDLYRKLGRGIDLVILDMIMREMDGRGCFRTLRAIDPEVKVLLSSGFSIDDDAKALLAEGAMGFVQKPFEKESLLRKISEVMK
jgi:two-component system, cell cycle sensor histidine kinase and response regulator CckA